MVEALLPRTVLMKYTQLEVRVDRVVSLSPVAARGNEKSSASYICHKTLANQELYNVLSTH